MPLASKDSQLGILKIINLFPAISQVKNRHKRSIVYTMLLAFVFNLLLPFFASYSLSSAQAASVDDLSALIGDKVLICTSSGYKWVTLSEWQYEEPAPESGKHYKCPLCYLHVDKPEAIPSDYSMLLAVSSTYQVSTWSAVPLDNPKTLRLLVGPSTRAPPATNLL